MNEPKNDGLAQPAECQSAYDTWFVSEVEKGLAAADRGELIDHETVRAIIDNHYLGLRSAKGAQHTQPRYTSQK